MTDVASLSYPYSTDDYFDIYEKELIIYGTKWIVGEVCCISFKIQYQCVTTNYSCTVRLKYVLLINFTFDVMHNYILQGRSQTNALLTGYLDFEVNTYTDDGRFIVVFNDMANSYALTLAMGEVSYIFAFNISSSFVVSVIQLLTY